MPTIEELNEQYERNPLEGIIPGGTRTKKREEPKPQSYYDAIKKKFADERDLRVNLRPEGSAQYTSDFEGSLSKYLTDPYGGEIKPRAPLNDTVEVLFIGGGFSALLTSARLRELGVESIRIVEKGADVGGTWYWNRY
ncbi:MAG: NAD(P)-binding protein, partial [Alphaproteobacteria bacterium]|nr:NAD(P)-binding protein [Alphaproteobacteria bacterium]